MVLVLNLGKIHDLCNLGPNPKVDPYGLKFHRSEKNRGQPEKFGQNLNKQAIDGEKSGNYSQIVFHESL